jgi:hypothetical protein
MTRFHRLPRSLQGAAQLGLDAAQLLFKRQSLRGATQLGLDATDLLLAVQHNQQSEILARLRRSPHPQASPLNRVLHRGLDIAAIAVARQSKLEKDLLDRLYQSVEGRFPTVTPDSPPTSPRSEARTLTRQTTLPGSTPIPSQPLPALRGNRPALEGGGALQVTAREGQGRAAVPLTLRNHYESSQIIPLYATALPTATGADLPLDRLQLQPTQVKIPAKAEATVYLLLNIDPSFRAGQDYWAEIHIGGADPRRLPLHLTLLPPDTSPPTPVTEPSIENLENEESE